MFILLKQVSSRSSQIGSSYTKGIQSQLDLTLSIGSHILSIKDAASALYTAAPDTLFGASKSSITVGGSILHPAFCSQPTEPSDIDLTLHYQIQHSSPLHLALKTYLNSSRTSEDFTALQNALGQANDSLQDFMSALQRSMRATVKPSTLVATESGLFFFLHQPRDYKHLGQYPLELKVVFELEKRAFKADFSHNALSIQLYPEKKHVLIWSESQRAEESSFWITHGVHICPDLNIPDFFRDMKATAKGFTPLSPVPTIVCIQHLMEWASNSDVRSEDLSKKISTVIHQMATHLSDDKRGTEEYKHAVKALARLQAVATFFLSQDIQAYIDAVLKQQDPSEHLFKVVSEQSSAWPTAKDFIMHLAQESYDAHTRISKSMDTHFKLTPSRYQEILLILNKQNNAFNTLFDDLGSMTREAIIGSMRLLKNGLDAPQPQAPVFCKHVWESSPPSDDEFDCTSDDERSEPIIHHPKSPLPSSPDPVNEHGLSPDQIAAQRQLKKIRKAEAKAAREAAEREKQEQLAKEEEAKLAAEKAQQEKKDAQLAEDRRLHSEQEKKTLQARRAKKAVEAEKRTREREAAQRTKRNEKVMRRAANKEAKLAASKAEEAKKKAAEDAKLAAEKAKETQETTDLERQQAPLPPASNRELNQLKLRCYTFLKNGKLSDELSPDELLSILDRVASHPNPQFFRDMTFRNQTFDNCLKDLFSKHPKHAQAIVNTLTEMLFAETILAIPMAPTLPKTDISYLIKLHNMAGYLSVHSPSLAAPDVTLTNLLSQLGKSKHEIFRSIKEWIESNDKHNPKYKRALTCCFLNNLLTILFENDALTKYDEKQEQPGWGKMARLGPFTLQAIIGLFSLYQGYRFYELAKFGNSTDI